MQAKQAVHDLHCIFAVRCVQGLAVRRVQRNESLTDVF